MIVSKFKAEKVLVASGDLSALHMFIHVKTKRFQRCLRGEYIILDIASGWRGHLKLLTPCADQSIT